MTQYKWTHETPRIRSDGTRIEKGELFEPTDHELRTWGSGRRQRIVEVDESGGSAEDADTEATGGSNDDVAAGMDSLDDVESGNPGTVEE